MKLKLKDGIVKDSLWLAEITGKQHKNVTRDIRDEVSKLQQKGITTELIFELSEYKDSTGRKLPLYILNEKGILQMGARYDAGIRFRLIEEVEKFREILKIKNSTEWLEARKNGKMIRRKETDAIQDYLIPLAIKQGSKNYNKLYITYSRLVNSICELKPKQRENLKDNVLMYVSFIEDFIQKTIIEEVENGTYYKDIYKICKIKCDTLKKINPPCKDKYIAPLLEDEM